MKKILVLLIVTLSATLLHAEDEVGYMQQGSPSSLPRQPAPAEDSSSKLAALIQNSLRNDPGGRFGNVSVSVKSGYVTLRGTVANQNDQNALVQLVLGIRGVNGINNQVTLK